jgi:hypothetical protein
VFVEGEGDEQPKRAPMETPMTDALAACEAAISAQRTALTGDLVAFTAAERCQRWRSQGSAPPLIVSLGDGDLVCGYGAAVARLVPCFNAVGWDGAGTGVRVRMSTADAHTWDSAYLVPLETASPEANREALVDLAAAQYARDWLEDMRHRIAARALAPLE